MFSQFFPTLIYSFSTRRATLWPSMEEVPGLFGPPPLPLPPFPWPVSKSPIVGETLKAAIFGTRVTVKASRDWSRSRRLMAFHRQKQVRSARAICHEDTDVLS